MTSSLPSAPTPEEGETRFLEDMKAAVHSCLAVWRNDSGLHDGWLASQIAASALHAARAFNRHVPEEPAPLVTRRGDAVAPLTKQDREAILFNLRNPLEHLFPETNTIVERYEATVVALETAAVPGPQASEGQESAGAVSAIAKGEGSVAPACNAGSHASHQHSPASPALADIERLAKLLGEADRRLQLVPIQERVEKYGYTHSAWHAKPPSEWRGIADHILSHGLGFNPKEGKE